MPGSMIPYPSWRIFAYTALKSLKEQESYNPLYSYFGHYKCNISKQTYLLYLINDLIHFLHIFKPNIFRTQSIAFSFHVFIGFFIFQL